MALKANDVARRCRRPFPLSVVVVVATVAGACALRGSVSGSSDAPVSGVPSPGLAWTPCGTGIECATLAVPVDHARPDGPTLDLAVARRPAPGDRRGSVVVNPGGPGASGVQLLEEGGIEGGALDGFDVVSWDPRGVGDSRRLDCERSVPDYQALDWTPDDPAEARALDEGARRIAEDCRRAAGDLAPHLATDDTVADLDRIRAALGEERLTYLGLSYGTAIGLRYAARHPDRVRAMVLDGVTDPRQDLAASLGEQARALERHLHDALGPDLALYDRVMAAAEVGRIPVGPTTVAFAAIAASYGDRGAAALTAALTQAEGGQPDPLRTLASTYWSAASTGAYTAVVCSDQPHPDGAAAHDLLVADLTRDAPRVGAVIANELRACAWWPAAPPPAGIAAPGSPPILVVGNTGDVATPYPTAVRVARDIGPGVLVTYEGQGHTSLGRSGCVDDHVRRYLRTSATPSGDARCQ